MSEYQLHRSFAPASSWTPDRILRARGRWHVLIGNKVRGLTITLDESIEKPEDPAAAFELMSLSGSYGDYKGNDFYRGKSSNYEQWRLYEHVSSLLSTDSNEFSTVPSAAKFLAGYDNVSSQYRTFFIPKRNGSRRRIEAPEGLLAAYQRQLLGCLTHLSRRHQACHGFELERSIVTHAKRHVRKRFVLTVDIEDFFPTITSNRIYGLFRAQPFNAPSDVARYLTNLTTYKGKLPQGAPTSPILANLICRRLDSKLSKWARKNGWDYSRYADDMAFSTQNSHIDEKDLEAIQMIVEREGFKVKVSKTKLRHAAQRQMVTGLVVNKRLNVKREYLRNLRALLFNINTFGWHSQIARKQLIDISKDEYEQYFSRSVSEIPLAVRREAILSARKDEHILLRKEKKHIDGNHLAKRIRGRIDFVERVRGEADLLVKDLWQGFEAARERLSRDTGLFIPQKRRSTHHQVRVIIKTHEGKSEHESRFDYAAIRRDVIEQLPNIPELIWLCKKPQHKGFLLSLYNVANEADLRPEDTQSFISFFEDYRAFRGLLHGASVLDNGKVKLGPNELFVEEILGVIQRVSEAYPIPSSFSSECLELVSKCREWVKLDASKKKNRIVHPYNDPEFRASVLDPFKRTTRFDRSKDGTGASSTLKNRIQIACSSIPQDRVKIVCKGRGPTFYGHVPSLIAGIRTIIASMVQHTESDTVTVELSTAIQETGRTCRIRIYDQESMITRPPTVPDMFTGELQEAVRNLRGFAHWKVKGTFEDGDFQLDVLGSLSPKPLSARKERFVEHTIEVPIS